MQEYVTVKEAAEIIGVDESQVRRYIYAGRLKAIDLGKQWLLDREQVRKFRRPPPGNPNFRKNGQ